MTYVFKRLPTFAPLTQSVIQNMYLHINRDVFAQVAQAIRINPYPNSILAAIKTQLAESIGNDLRPQ
jgi:hypothetical protein